MNCNIQLFLFLLRIEYIYWNVNHLDVSFNITDWLFLSLSISPACLCCHSLPPSWPPKISGQTPGHPSLEMNSPRPETRTVFQYGTEGERNIYIERYSFKFWCISWVCASLCTCRAPNSIISSSVQSISSNKIAHRACSYNCVKRTASYYNKDRNDCLETISDVLWMSTHIFAPYLGIHIMESVVFKTKPKFVIFFNSLLHQWARWIQPPRGNKKSIDTKKPNIGIFLKPVFNTQLYLEWMCVLSTTLAGR